MKLPLSFRTVSTALLCALLFIHCDDGLPDDPFANVPSSLVVDLDNGYSSIDVNKTQNIVNDFPSETLSFKEISGIAFVREEEKLITDYFDAVADLYNDDFLENISTSEATHFGVISQLLNKYNLDDPVDGQARGEFLDPAFQAYYNSRIAEGETALLAALIEGTSVLEANLVTLRNQMDRIANNRDLRYVYGALLSGTRNHLRAIVRVVENNGGSYTARFLDPVDLREVVRSAYELG